MSILKPFTAIAVVSSLLAWSMPVAAQSGYKIDRGAYAFSKKSQSKQPRHGYSGFYKGPSQLFCDYERTPNRTCDSRGRCRVTSWTLKEYCY